MHLNSNRGHGRQIFMITLNWKGSYNGSDFRDQNFFQRKYIKSHPKAAGNNLPVNCKAQGLVSSSDAYICINTKTTFQATGFKLS